MNMIAGAAWMFLAVLSQPCRGEKEIPKFQWEPAGRGCQLPPRDVYIQWWNKTGKPGLGFNVGPRRAIDTHRIGRRYDPTVVWVTSENASACVKGQLNPTADPCVGYYYIPCATSLYQLKVHTRDVVVEVRRSMRRENDPGRCEVDAKLNERFSEGETITIKFRSLDGKVSACSKVIDLALLGGGTIRDRCDVQADKWVGPTKRARRRPPTRVLEAVEDIRASKLPDEIEIELTPVAP